MTTSKPEEFAAIDCRDGIAIVKPGMDYEVTVDGRFDSAHATLWDAMQAVAAIKAERGAK